MNISTGLEPVIERWRVQPRKGAQFMEFGHISGMFPLPTDYEEIWVVELKTRKDTCEHPRGTTMQVMVLRSEPKVEKRSVKISIPGEDTGSAGDAPLIRAVDHHKIPKDAIREEHWIGVYHMKEHVISWYELEV